LVPLALVPLAAIMLCGAPPAQADVRDCQGGEICFWPNENFTGARWYAGGDWTPGTCWNLPPSINNRASSAANHRAWEIETFDGANCTNQLGWIHVNTNYPSLRIHGIDNKITSIRFTHD
jgi:hypothetical protein